MPLFSSTSSKSVFCVSAIASGQIVFCFFRLCFAAAGRAYTIIQIATSLTANLTRFGTIEPPALAANAAGVFCHELSTTRTNRSIFQRHKNSSVQDIQMNAAGRFPHGVHLHLEKETVKGYTNLRCRITAVQAERRPRKRPKDCSFRTLPMFIC